ncbi:hypothetical protein EW146_g1992 [Bondarzewia mesenterica]|uniref:Haloacid dehalogenase, type II n=1 Tax=Bondarzewia mesenterica TaxID=1095465 RepID=A0A4S4M287_9AGAM|nr:hypothetical protein EW146_g1992 [Bondarzewia mesenterica]
MSTAPEPKLTQFKAIIFDVYGTLVDWETGLYAGLSPLINTILPADEVADWTRRETILAFGSVEKDLQFKHPDMLYRDVLAAAFVELAKRLESAVDGSVEMDGVRLKEEGKKFGDSIKDWPVFPDTRDALQYLAQHFALVVLSNVDHASFAHTHKALSDPTTTKSPFSLVITAQDVGAYKPSLAMYNRALADIQSKFGIEKHEVLVVAQSLFHDHVPANELGIPSVWIDRQGACAGVDVQGGQVDVEVRDVLGGMAEAVKEETKG